MDIPNAKVGNFHANVSATPLAAMEKARAGALPKFQLLLRGSFRLFYFLCLLERPKLRRHLHLGAAMQQISCKLAKEKTPDLRQRPFLLVTLPPS
jgi:hypothetical protein